MRGKVSWDSRIEGTISASSSSPASSRSIGTRAKPSASRAPRSLRARKKRKVSAQRGIVQCKTSGRGRVGARRAFRRGRVRSTPGLEKTKKFRRASDCGTRRSPRARVAFLGRGRTCRALFSTCDGTRVSRRLARASAATGRGSHRYARLLPSPRFRSLTHYSQVLSSPTHREPRP